MRLGREAAEADCDALDLVYRLLNVHVHLLIDLVDPRGIRGAGRLCVGFGYARRTPPTVGCWTRGTEWMKETQLGPGSHHEDANLGSCVEGEPTGLSFIHRTAR